MAVGENDIVTLSIVHCYMPLGYHALVWVLVLAPRFSYTMMRMQRQVFTIMQIRKVMLSKIHVPSGIS
ncbi:hypothetical protein BJY04DRAFT_178572 [Aspergillus karnatakaensis]|uniref:uncharacterized protein n=1 Tax=Aspergillus karnatakaensis TaxID=1810916 RepID=UPI003CCE3F79